MSTTTTADLESDEKARKRGQWDQFSFDVDAPGMVDVTNESYEDPDEHQYTVTLDDVTGDAMACTCPHHVHRNAHCKHMAAVEHATADGSLDAFPADDASDKTDDGPRITGPHVGQDKYGNVDHRYWRCEHCGTETTDKRALDACC
ncbi:SWIM zinc finger family protein [Halomicrococcus sp. NG-SE-24]|uniref:SWIM zinc finger family protein n=1 Tax=Halomicrococcus sp. NG-SE-24 TaxID=3436928 RepID=UPI003D96EE28